MVTAGVQYIDDFSSAILKFSNPKGDGGDGSGLEGVSDGDTDQDWYSDRSAVEASGIDALALEDCPARCFPVRHAC